MHSLIPSTIRNHLRTLRYPQKKDPFIIKKNIKLILESLGYAKDVSENVASNFCKQHVIPEHRDKERNPY